MTRARRTNVLTAFAVVTLSALFPANALADHMDNCRTISEADAAKLQGRTAVVTDIDGVLNQYVLLDYGPTNGAFLDKGIAYPRTNAALMMNIYHRRGYLVVYMAGRPRQMDVLGKSMCQATLDWLEMNGFPTEQGDTLLLLRNGAKSVVDAKSPGTAMAEWMGDHGTDLFASMVNDIDDHYSITPAYGYVDSDVVTNAFLKVGVPADHIFTIGNKGMSRLGYKGTTTIMGPEANPGYTQHIRDFVVPDVPSVDAAAGLSRSGPPATAAGLDDMTGCWISKAFDATSMLTSSTEADSAQLDREKMLLRFARIDGTDYLAFGRIYEWDERKSYVLGPTYQNGAYNPAAGFLTFGFPEGGLDHVTQPDANALLYVHTKSSDKSAMSVRPLMRIDCVEADKIEAELLERQKELGG